MIDLCWQSLLTFAKDYNAVAAALLTMALVGIFWFFRFLLGHKLYVITTCLNKNHLTNRCLRWTDLHDWERSEEQLDVSPIISNTSSEYFLLYCNRCHLRKAISYPRDVDTQNQTPRTEEYVEIRRPKDDPS